MTGIYDASSTGNHVVNGDLSMLDSKEDQKTILEMESSEQSSNCKDGRGDQSLHGNLAKVPSPVKLNIFFERQLN